MQTLLEKRLQRAYVADLEQALSALESSDVYKKASSWFKIKHLREDLVSLRIQLLCGGTYLSTVDFEKDFNKLLEDVYNILNHN